MEAESFGVERTAGRVLGVEMHSSGCDWCVASEAARVDDEHKRSLLCGLRSGQR